MVVKERISYSEYLVDDNRVKLDKTNKKKIMFDGP